MIISDPSSEVFPLDLHIEEISDQSFECCFLINTLAVKARNKGKRVTIPSEYAPYIILQTHNSTHKNPAPNSPIILLIGKEKYLCLDGNHRLQAAFKCGKKSIGYVINEKMLDSSDFFSLYDYYNFVLSITYSPLVEGVKMNCSKDLIDGLNKYLSRVKFLLEE